MKAIFFVVVSFLLIIDSLIGQIAPKNKKYSDPDTLKTIRQSDSYKNIDNMPIIQPDSSLMSENKKLNNPDTTRKIRQIDNTYENIDNMLILIPDMNGKLIIKKPDKSP